mmetsp:Transcript_39250/g.111115  ORF Transcript_39250/g.111115 Transcript_39250/m.111115 type:complete len:219 (+) Transcript_39250:532-1188(+)
MVSSRSQQGKETGGRTAGPGGTRKREGVSEQFIAAGTQLQGPSKGLEERTQQRGRDVGKSLQLTGGDCQLGSRAQASKAAIGDGVAWQQVRSPVWDNGDTEAKGHGDGHNKADAAGHWDRGDDLDSRHSNVGKQHGCHASQDWRGDAGEERPNLAKDPKEQEPHGAPKPSQPGRNPCQRHHSVVLGEGGVRHCEGNGGKEGVHGVSQKSSLHCPGLLN